jgi:hypothetical protein
VLGCSAREGEEEQQEEDNNNNNNNNNNKVRRYCVALLKIVPFINVCWREDCLK